jgi:phosphoglucosamine mutase
VARQRKLFGTDGVRGEAGAFLGPELATALGRAAVAASGVERPQVLIVRDTRESGPMLEAALAAGIAAAGGDALLGGVLPTPAASVLARRYGFDRAAVVSASHNPFRDNGIKFFDGTGAKLDDEQEAEIEALLEAAPAPASPGRVTELRGAFEDYLRALEAHFPLALKDLTVALDCANGATYQAAPAIFERLGATVVAHADEPDGRNINDGCGSTHIDHLAGRIAGEGADLGFAFDGDGDRMLAVDRYGRVHDGDELIALATERLRRGGELHGGIAVTVMTNYGFLQAMRERGVEVAVTDVGDRYVLEALRQRDWRLGGEQSGHIIDMDFTPTGDGIAAALRTVEALDGRRLEEIETFRKLPQTLVNVEVTDRGAVAGAKPLWEAVDAANEGLNGRGRVLVRPSGTEPLVRVMVEAPEAGEAEDIAGRLAAVVRAELA